MTELQKALFSKARKALSSARTSLEHEDTDGATNRCYYAMFYAARAALSMKDENPTSYHHRTIIIDRLDVQ